MTTKFLDNKICTFKILLSWRFHEQQRFGRFSSLPQSTPPPPLKHCKFYFYCRLAVSEQFAGVALHCPTKKKGCEKVLGRVLRRVLRKWACCGLYIKKGL